MHSSQRPLLTTYLDERCLLSTRIYPLFSSLVKYFVEPVLLVMLIVTTFGVPMTLHGEVNASFLESICQFPQSFCKVLAC